jgi:cytochrome c
MSGVGKKYPAYFNMAKKEMTLKEVINFCIEVPLKGKALPAGDERLLALEAYLKSL